jgi:hypothetical protein
MGMVPNIPQPADLVCLFIGGNVLFVTRPHEDGAFTLIGHCYLEGVMDGEAMELELPTGEFRPR